MYCLVLTIPGAVGLGEVARMRLCADVSGLELLMWEWCASSDERREGRRWWEGCEGSRMMRMLLRVDRMVSSR